MTGDPMDRLDQGTGTIGDAVEAMRQSERVARAGWNGRGMFLYLAKSGEALPVENDIGTNDLAPFVVMRTATGEHVPWLCSQTDLLAADWCFSPGERDL